MFCLESSSTEFLFRYCILIPGSDRIAVSHHLSEAYEATGAMLTHAAQASSALLAPAPGQLSATSFGCTKKSALQGKRSSLGPVITHADAVKIFRARQGKTRHDAARLAATFGVTAKAIRDIWRGRTWKRATMHLRAHKSIGPNHQSLQACAMSSSASSSPSQISTAPVFTNVKFDDGWMVDHRVIAYFMSN